MVVDKFYALILRTTAFLAVVYFASLDNNPLVKFQARLGLSPSPLEKLFHLKGMFSGMTEGMHRLALGDIIGAMSANVLTPLFAIVFSLCFLGGYRPRIKTKRQENLFFFLVIVLSVVVNLVNTNV